ncbi:unnamed protein product [Phytomonas sp. Hart1]|nr:unnamed protein product [Phytomonas sp. Hart1]|eukprot:CCW69780.1 unnamed protein product [Phytomonas sp. isolate Hart1]
MSPWPLFQRQFLNMIARNPQFRVAFKKSVERALRTPTFRNLKHKSETAYQRILNIATDVSGKRQSHGKPQFSHFNILRRKLLLFWHQHKIKFFAFLTANFMGILFIFQMLPLIYSKLRMGVNYLTSPLPPSKKNHCQDTEKNKSENILLEREDCSRKPSKLTNDPPNGLNLYQHQHNEGVMSQLFTDETSASNNTLFSSSALFDDTLTNNDETLRDKGVYLSHQKNTSNLSTTKKKFNIDYQTSFLVKMDGDTEFTSSLERENLTGAITTSGIDHV